MKTLIRLTFVILFFISNLSYAGYFITGPSTAVTGIFPSYPDYCEDIATCYTSFPESIQYDNGYSVRDSGRCPRSVKSGDHLVVYYRAGNVCTSSSQANLNYRFPIVLDDGNQCTDENTCRAQATEECASSGLVLTSFNFIGVGTFDSSCGEPSPSEECENTVTQYCESRGGFSSSNLLQDGSGGSSCSGSCQDGSTLGNDSGEPDCGTLSECDSVEPPSDLDFSNGNLGSSAGSGGDGSSSSGGDATSPDDTEHEIDYVPDGSGTSASENGGMSSLQGDKLINEVVKSRNDNTEHLTVTTNDTNAVIIEKSDDIQNTISNSANGIIDAINGIDTGGNGGNGAGLDDTGIINAIDGLSGRFDVNHESQGFPSEASAWGQGMFGTPKIEHLQSLTVGLKTAIDTENETFKTTLNSYVHFSSHDNGYQVNNLELGQWGSHDISISRFSEYFGGVANIVYFFAALTALGIVLGGVKS